VLGRGSGRGEGGIYDATWTETERQAAASESQLAGRGKKRRPRPCLVPKSNPQILPCKKEIPRHIKISANT
jgi:hypothetical protein